MGAIDPADPGRGVIVVAQEINRRRRSEEQVLRLNAGLEERVRSRTADLRDAVSALEAFSYSVSHDLRGPLRAISGYAALIAESAGSQLGGEERGLLERIGANVSRMNALIDGLLDISRSARAGALHPQQRCRF